LIIHYFNVVLLVFTSISFIVFCPQNLLEILV